MSKKHTVSSFLEKIKSTHSGKYEYYDLKNMKDGQNTIIEIICPIHGIFKQKAKEHIKGNGCIKCAGILRKTTNQFINEAIKIHKDKFDYSKVEYINSKKKIQIICKIHNIEFSQSPIQHLKGTYYCGCKECQKEYKRNLYGHKEKDVIEKFKIIHGEIYDYSKIQYINTHSQVIIICKIHGEFKQTPHDHLVGKGCWHCGQNKSHAAQRLSLPEFIERAKILHGNVYDYSKSIYHNNLTPVEIICKKHGSFWTPPVRHINKRQANGCPKCRRSIGEENIEKYLIKNNISYEHQKYFEDFNRVVGRDNVKRGRVKYDFYLPNNNILIEFDGLQHVKNVPYYYKKYGFEYRQKMDAYKNKYAEINKIPLLRIPYEFRDQIEKYFLEHDISLKTN